MAFATDTYVIKGMRQDDSDLLFNGNKEGLSFAFENLNMRFTTDTETTSLVATQEKGNVKCNIYVYDKFFMNVNDFAGSFYNLTNLPFRIVGHCEVDKYLVLFGKCLTTTIITNHDGISLTFEEGNDIILRLERQNDAFYGWLIYNSNELNFDLNWPLETLGNVETNLIKKVYFVDGINIPREVNVVNPDAGQLANINLGFDLSLKDKFSVKREYSVIGNYPVGKIRFFYTYFNDNFSETNIVDWSPFFDCSLDNQGGSPENLNNTTYAFRVSIDNVDPAFKFVRIYFQLFTENDATKYQLKYIERAISGNNISFVIKYDDADIKNAEQTYLDIKSTNITFIPYTFAEKDGRMFYGNIKRSLPDTSNIDFTNSANIVFKHKLIGFENLDSNLAYKYEPNNTTFQYSNYEYMGFRKDNWYRFGIIAQYRTGEWSDVFYITDAQCDISSKTEVQYENVNIGGTHFLQKNKPIRSEYYIPKAQLSPTATFIDNLQQLLHLGFKRIKPVCVVPPPQFRNVITQGISCSTLYTGGDRRLLSTTNNGLFAIPSYFFRPMPLFSTTYTLENGYRFKPKYPYTIRNVGDLKIGENIYTTGVDGAWFLNPTFTNEKFTNYNSVFREWRHGFSLPPKDRINAELQSSDFSLNDYRYLVQVLNDSSLSDAFVISPLFENVNGVNLFGFYNSTDNVLFKNINGNYEYEIDRNNPNWYYELKGQYGVLPWHNLQTTGYDSTVFVDESFCTLNSPEIDYVFERQVEPFYLNQNIEVVGFAQVTGSMANIDIPDTKFTKTVGTDLIASDCEEDFVVTGTCLRNLALKHGDRLNDDVIQYLNSTLTTSKLESNPFLPLCGPWWLDTMLVASFHHINLNNTIGAFNPDEYNIFGANNTHKLTDANGNEWSFGQNDIYNETSVGDELIKKPNGVWFIRNFNVEFDKDNRKFKWTPSFYGETQKNLSNNAESTPIGKTTYPYVIGPGDSSNKAAMFCDFLNGLVLSNIPVSWNAEKLAEYVNSWSSRSITWNTINLTPSVKNDGYWNKWLTNRTYIDISTGGIIPFGTVMLPFDFNYTTTLNDVVLAVSVGDFRGLFSYYFNPFLNSVSNADFYKVSESDNNHTQYLYINHPFLLPHNTDYTNREWIADGTYTVLNPSNTPANYLAAATIDEDEYYFNGSEYGCHYYAPFSTNFTGAYFDPYYAHVVYPFMANSRAPFCGTNDAYVQQEGDNDCRPSYNSTNSCLYSSCTNYINVEHDFDNIDTYSAYYHAPRITHELRSLPDLSKIPFVDPIHTTVSQLYSFNCSDDTQEGNTPKLYHNTYTLTAAMKWYRGFKSLHSSDSKFSLDDEMLISTGYNIDKDVIVGNLFFSGYLPQLFTKNGLLRYNDGQTELDSYTYKLGIDNTSGHQYDTANGKNWAKDLDNFIDNSTNLIINLDFLSTPHIVYYNSPIENGIYGNTLHLLSDFYVEDPLCTITNEEYNDYQFVPQFYWKEFVNELYCEPNNHATHQVKSALGWLKSTYPHCGHFESFMFDSLKRAADGQPFWNKNGNVFDEYPVATSRKNLQVEFTSKNLITYDNRGKDRKLSDYWVLPISNMYNRNLINQYTLNDKNPYTYQEGMSKEYWDWKMCGYTINLAEFLNPYTPVKRVIDYLEGDTYFQRYNCFKTISNDLIHSYLWDKDEDDPEVTLGINNVTETASVMIESYTNIDGLYWTYSSTVDFRVSPLVHPFWNNMKQINPVYSIQDNICDTFKEIDKNYYNSSLTHYPTMILWSIKKQDGETTDSWGIVPANNKILISGEMGAINKLLSFQDKIFCLQDHGLSVLNYDPQVISPTSTDSTLSVYLSDSTKLQGATYISRNIGTLNKWSVALSQQGFYWIDETLKQICGYMKTDTARYTIVDISSNYGFKSWSNANISSDNAVWSINTFLENNNSFKANYDLKNHDVYWANGDYCICFNELLNCFTSFYNYENIPYKFNYLDECYSIYNQTDYDTMWHDYADYTHSLYGSLIDSYIELLVNPSGQYDKVFNFIEYAAEKYDPQYDFDVALLKGNPYNLIRVNNTYQIGQYPIDKFNTQNRFKLWRTALPREIKNGKQTMNRIRSPWCKIKLAHVNIIAEKNKYRDKLYYINVNYTLPEQPLKTNIRS